MRSQWNRRFAAAALVLATAGCARPAGPLAPVEPAAVPTSAPGQPRPDPIAPPAAAAALGWMPLASTNVPGFLARHPDYDGRGVLIAVLDGGVDPGTTGLRRLPGGGPKLVDVRDFSGEGRIALREVIVERAGIRIGGRLLRGAGRVRALHAGGPVYGGILDEVLLGQAPAADLNGNGVVGDSLPVIVFRASDGWVLLTDTDGDGSLEGERPVRDFAVARETFTWTSPSAPPTVHVAVNLRDRGTQAPELDLVFDTSGHGTHVAGIAAGHGLYGIPGFDGVAPGAELLGLKFANDARGGITVTGSMLKAMEYAIDYARTRRQPLVINMSFGVGNERAGAARIDAIVDSVLAANPDVVLTTSAGNDGPGLSTIGFPASARRVINVGATYPGAFLPPQSDGASFPDLVAFFSARGGDLAGPDLVAPGVAYSSVPGFDAGEEIKHGTSMAAPHVAGLAALLLSGLAAEHRTQDAAAIRRALTGASRPPPGGTYLDHGAGQPDVLHAWELLRARPSGAIEVDAVDHGVTAAWHEGPLPEVQAFRLRRAPAAPDTFFLHSDRRWIVPPDRVTLSDTATVLLQYLPGLLNGPGAHVGVVEGWGADSAFGPAFRLVTTVAIPRAPRSMPDTVWSEVAPGELNRTFVVVDSGVPFRVSVTESRGAPLLVFLHEPGGMPWRDGPAAMVSGEDTMVVFSPDGRDVTGGLYEVVLVAGPAVGVEPMAILDPSPVAMALGRSGDSVVTVLAKGTDISPAEWATEVVGFERTMLVDAVGSDDLYLPFTLPPWTGRVLVEVTMGREDWPRFTDFGLTLMEADGRLLETSPITYHVGRLAFEPEAREPERGVAIVLSPGFADPAPAEPWRATVAIRLYADNPVPVASGVLSGARTREARLLPDLPWPAQVGFVPLTRVTSRIGLRTWTREAALPEEF